MDNHQEDNLDEQYYRDSNWVAYNGGYIHSNNVLFYFAQSPFFDRQSSNTSIFLQALSNPHFGQWLNTRESFEAQLRRLSGLEYVVAHDPLATNVQTDGPNGKEFSNVWVIKKQQRAKRAGQEDQVTVLAFYYIVGDAIYQAPSVAKVMANRMLSTVTSLSKMLSAAAPLPVFAPSFGHTYFPPVQKPTQQTAHLGLSQQSKDTTPAPGSHTDTVQKATAKPATSDAHQVPDVQDTRTLIEAIDLSLRYGKEYMNELPLVGEPGNFRLSTKSKDALAPLPDAISTTQQAVGSQQASRKGTPAASSQPPPPLPIQTDVPPAASRKSAKSADSKSPATPGASMKPKRRKSKAAIKFDEVVN